MPDNTSCDKEMKIQLSNVLTTFKMKGLIYLGSFHFNICFIDNDDCVGFHDGMVSGRNLIKECHIDLMQKNVNYALFLFEKN